MGTRLTQGTTYVKFSLSAHRPPRPWRRFRQLVYASNWIGDKGGSTLYTQVVVCICGPSSCFWAHNGVLCMWGVEQKGPRSVLHQVTAFVIYGARTSVVTLQNCIKGTDGTGVLAYLFPCDALANDIGTLYNSSFSEALRDDASGVLFNCTAGSFFNVCTNIVQRRFTRKHREDTLHDHAGSRRHALMTLWPKRASRLFSSIVDCGDHTDRNA